MNLGTDVNKIFQPLKQMFNLIRYSLIFLVSIPTIVIIVYMLVQMNFVKSDQVSDFFEHPFILLVTGALITSIIVPYLTNKWQDHKKKLEIKTTLLTKMSEALTEGLTQLYMLQVQKKNTSKR